MKHLLFLEMKYLLFGVAGLIIVAALIAWIMYLHIKNDPSGM
jgi:hypothetical protein